VTRPTVTVEIDWAVYDPNATDNFILDVDALDSASVLASGELYSDVSAYVRDVSVRRGRQRAVDRFTAGTASVVLTNTDARFDPSNTSGPYTANGISGIVPMRPIRISATYGATTYRLFTGYIDSLSFDYAPGLRDATVTLACSDGMKLLSQADGAVPQVAALVNATAASSTVTVTTDQSNTSSNGYTIVTTPDGRARLITTG
jgi:hypothetical protein